MNPKKEQLDPDGENEYVNRKDLCDHFKISLNTLIKLEKNGVIKPYVFGNRCFRYSIPEVKQAICVMQDETEDEHQ